MLHKEADVPDQKINLNMFTLIEGYEPIILEKYNLFPIKHKAFECTYANDWLSELLYFHVFNYPFVVLTNESMSSFCFQKQENRCCLKYYMTIIFVYIKTEKHKLYDNRQLYITL